jgi:hypothetical protein
MNKARGRELQGAAHDCAQANSTVLAQIDLILQWNENRGVDNADDLSEQSMVGQV